MSAAASHARSLARRERLTLVATCLPLFVIFLDTTIVYVVLPAVQRDLSTGVEGAQWVIDAFTLLFGALLLTGGTLGDRYGRHRVFVAGVAGFAAGSVVCAAAPTVALLIAGRAMQGVGAALALPTSLALLSLSFPDPRRRARAIGIWVAASAAALAIGPLAGGVLVAELGWRSVFLVNVPVCVAGCILMASVRPLEPRAARTGLDLRGQLLVVAGIATLTFGAIEGDRRGWGSLLIVAVFAAAALCLTAFARREVRGRGELLRVGYFRSSSYSLANALGALAYFTLFGVMLLLTLFLQQIEGYSALDAGVRFLPLTAAVALMSLAAGALAGRRDPRLLMAVGALLMAAGLIGVAGIGPGDSFPSYAWVLVVLGAGTSLVTTPGTVAVIAAVRPDESAAASGVVASFRLIGSTLGVAVLGTLAANRFDSRVAAAGVPEAFTSALQLAAAIAAVLMLCGAVVAVAVVAARPVLTRLRGDAVAVERPT